jgi:hypothetical protein
VTSVSTAMVGEIQDFEREEYAHTIDVRVETTVDSLTAIAQYLSGIPGRKNLIWVSQAFPVSMLPQTDTGNNPFRGTRDYSAQLDAVSRLLTDAQVAVYPADAMGLDTNESLSASQQFNSRPRAGAPDGGFSARMRREDNNRDASQATMDSLAKESGGKTCKNTNDISKCIDIALKETASYYELGFYPQNIAWDGRFHKVTVKTTRPGVKLTYRAGYFASDAEALAKTQNPDALLRDACSRLMPPTGIGLTARPATAEESRGAPGALSYQLVIAPSDVTFAPYGDSHKLDVQIGFCTYGAKPNAATLTKQSIAVAVRADVMQRWQSVGIPDMIATRPDSGLQRVRAVVLDVPTAAVGAIDIPVRPEDYARATASASAAAAASALKPVAPSQIDIPDKSPTPIASAQLNFKGPSGDIGTLQWEKSTLVYSGSLAIAQSAPAFFKYAFGGSYRCDAGKLLPVASTSPDAQLLVTFQASDGKQLAVDLKGTEPAYSGDLVLDPSAKTFFDAVWKISHCQSVVSQ